jgi:hypothetical protein
MTWRSGTKKLQAERTAPDVMLGDAVHQNGIACSRGLAIIPLTDAGQPMAADPEGIIAAEKCGLPHLYICSTVPRGGHGRESTHRVPNRYRRKSARPPPVINQGLGMAADLTSGSRRRRALGVAIFGNDAAQGQAHRSGCWPLGQASASGAAEPCRICDPKAPGRRRGQKVAMMCGSSIVVRMPGFASQTTGIALTTRCAVNPGVKAA